MSRPYSGGRISQAKNLRKALLATCFKLVSCLASYSSTLNMEATCFSETSGDFQRSKLRYTPEDRTLFLPSLWDPQTIRKFKSVCLYGWSSCLSQFTYPCDINNFEFQLFCNYVPGLTEVWAVRELIWQWFNQIDWVGTSCNTVWQSISTVLKIQLIALLHCYYYCLEFVLTYWADGKLCKGIFGLCCEVFLRVWKHTGLINILVYTKWWSTSKNNVLKAVVQPIWWHTLWAYQPCPVNIPYLSLCITLYVLLSPMECLSFMSCWYVSCCIRSRSYYKVMSEQIIFNIKFNVKCSKSCVFLYALSYSLFLAYFA
jgi:hypothetical protein